MRMHQHRCWVAVGFFLPFVAFAFSFQPTHNQYHNHNHNHNHNYWHSRRRIGHESSSKSKLFGGKTTSADKTEILVGDLVGSGSYGTVHKLQQLNLKGDEDEDEHDVNKITYIGKRPWKQDELKQNNPDEENPRERAARCLYYWQVEEHCFSKLPPHPQLPAYFGTKQEWMVFGLIGNKNGVTENGDTIVEPAPTLGDLMKLDCDRPQDLFHLSQAMNTKSYAETVDKVLTSLLTVLEHIHDHKIVHRDVKPNNLLVDSSANNNNGQLVLMDFGSAADLEKSSGLLGKRWGLENGSRVAVSPIYCAPEIFIDIYHHPTAFDIFSAGLLFSQLLFSYLEERMDAGFYQQLQDTGDWDLNLWLANELGSKLRPSGLDHSLEYLAERPGLWTLLERMLAPDPERRPTATQALKRLGRILKQAQVDADRDGNTNDDNEDLLEDGPFFSMVIESMETCEIPTMSRALQFVATFERKQSLGLVLSEIDQEEDDPLWKEATKDAFLGEVFVKEIVEGGQADELGIFEIGDRLQGVGELAFTYGGFERAVEMLQDQPRNSKYVKLHFDRIRVRDNEAISMIPSEDVEIRIKDLGAWSSKGKRKTQEDAFVLHEIHDAKDRSVLLIGVMDGHGGTAASTMVSNEMPTLLSNQLLVNRLSVPEALKESWDIVCTGYQQQCADGTECVAEYDPRQGFLMANTGSEDLIAGTTTSVLALDEKTGRLTALNCGDSRSLVVTSKGKVQFATEDHTPQTEEDRLQKGVDTGFDYSLPKCRISKWSISVGDYEYSVGRSLEGPFATSKGLVSDADVKTMAVEPGEILLSATDGLWEVMDSEEVALDLHKMRNEGMPARDAARTLCSMALRKGTPDNVSVVVVYL